MLLKHSALLKPLYPVVVPPKTHSIEFDSNRAYQFCENPEIVERINSEEAFGEGKTFCKEELLNLFGEFFYLEELNENSINSFLAKNKIIL